MVDGTEKAVVLMADDDPDDIMLVRDALQACKCNVDFRYVENGEEAMDYLLGQGKYSDPALAPRPSLVLLDLNMPMKDGIETLKEIKCHREIREIPVVVLTTSRDRELMMQIYRLGGSSFVSKPVEYQDMIRAMDRLCAYWFGTVSLPRPGECRVPPATGVESSGNGH